MKALGDFLHKTPWWALVLAGLVGMIALAVFVTPFNIIQYRYEGATAVEKRAIKREIDNAFAEQAINMAKGVLHGMRDASRDPERRAELDDALRELEGARRELREAGSEVMRAKREALEATREASRAASEAITQALRQAEESMKAAGADNEEVRKALRESLKAAESAEKESRRQLKEAIRKGAIAGLGSKEGKPLISIEIDTDADKKVPAEGAAKDSPGVEPPPSPPLPPELRRQIHSDVLGDMYRIGIGAALVLILIPLFILAMIAKFFIDRSRAAQRLADLKKKEAEYHQMTQQVTEAKLQALQAQVEPHFLYNTLASVQALTEVDPAAASTMTGHLIQYLRNALPKMRESISTVGQEIELVRAYLNILQMRMGTRLAFDIDVPFELSALAFPPLMLPSLVENAIKHGLEPQREGGKVTITAERVDGKLRLRVADTGRGFGENIGAGVGLANIRERLAALHGDAGRLTLEANVPQGVVATIEIPTDGTRAPAKPMDPAADAPAIPAKPQTVAAKTLAAMGTAERAWRKSLSFVFVALVIVAAVVCGLAIFGAVTGLFPVRMGGEELSGPGGAIVGTAGIALAFLVIVLALGIVVAVIYGLGFLVVGLAIFIPVVIAIAVAPALAPFILLGLLIWWILRRKKAAQPPVAQ
jgi:hypothetical protein